MGKRRVLGRVVGAIATVGCVGKAQLGTNTSQPGPKCLAAPDSTGAARLIDVFVNGERVAGGARGRLEQAFPEVYSLDVPEPDAVRRIAPAAVDLIQFVRGPEAEATYGLCSGYVAMLITTKPS